MKYAALLLIAAAAVAQGKPEYDWKPLATETIELAPGSTRTVDASWTGGKTRIKVSASSAVSFAVDFTECHAPDVTEATRECAPNPDSVLRISDRRKLSDAALPLLTRNSAAIANATNKNRVSIEITAFACVRNCRP